MRELDDQLRALARSIDEHVAPLDVDEILRAETLVTLRRRSRLRRTIALVLVAALAGTAAVAGVLVLRPDDGAPRVNISAPTTGTVARSTPRTRPCILRHASGDLYSLAQPVSIALPGGHAIPIVPGNPITMPNSVTLDSDGSTYPGQASNAASLLWGAATKGGPFLGLDRIAIGKVITLRQTTRGPDGFDCVQHWRTVRISGPSLKPWTERTLLRLVGFMPHGAAGPTVQFYVDAVPAVTTSAPTVSAPGSCTSTQLLLSLARYVGSVMNQPAAYFDLTNRSTTACTLTGYPKLTLFDTSGQLISTGIGNGNAYQLNDPGPHQVTVQPHQSVYFGFGWSRQNPNGDGKGCVYVARARVLVPNSDQSLTAAAPLNSAPFCPQSGGSVTAIAARMAFTITTP